MQAADRTQMETDGQSQGEVALAALFSRTLGFRGDSLVQPFSDDDLKSISNILLYDGKSSWSQIPRVYTVLRIIDCLNLMDEFVTEGITDLSFPFTLRTLPCMVKEPSTRGRFINAQGLVLTKALGIEQDPGTHHHFLEKTDIPFTRLGELGKGAYGFVEHVRSTISHKDYARKLIPRARTFGKDKEVLKQFESELAILKRLRHQHIVTLIGSYTDSKFVSLIMSPVADCNLREFLSVEPFTPRDRSIIRTFFGCLSTAIGYLHDQSIRHKDIKPQNILIKANHVLLADFGQSLDWRDSQHSTTSGFTLKTPKYCAPEVANYCPRNSSSDMWSLGCVFLEIWTVLAGQSLQHLDNYFRANGSFSPCYYLNIDSCRSWTTSLLEETSRRSRDNLSTPFNWISQLLQEAPNVRPTATMLLDNIRCVHESPENTISYLGSCCIGDDESVVNHDLGELSSTLVAPVQVLYMSPDKGQASTNLTEQLGAISTVSNPVLDYFLAGMLGEAVPNSMVLAINNRFSIAQLPPAQKFRTQTRSNLKKLPFFMRQEMMFPAVLYGIILNTALYPAVSNIPSPGDLTLKDMALMMTPALLRGFARHKAQGDSSLSETMAATDPLDEVHGMMVLGLNSQQRQAIHDWESDEEALTSADVEIVLNNGDRMLVEIGTYVWHGDRKFLVRKEREPPLKNYQGGFWYDRWMDEDIAKAERALYVTRIRTLRYGLITY